MVRGSCYWLRRIHPFSIVFIIERNRCSSSSVFVRCDCPLSLCGFLETSVFTDLSGDPGTCGATFEARFAPLPENGGVADPPADALDDATFGVVVCDVVDLDVDVRAIRAVVAFEDDDEGGSVPEVDLFFPGTCTYGFDLVVDFVFS